MHFNLFLLVLGNKRITRNQQQNKTATKKKTPKQAPVSLLSSKANWNGNLPPFEGTSELYALDNKSESEIEIDDEDWKSESFKKMKIPLNNALGALIGAYRSSDESDNDIAVAKTIISTEESTEIPDEIKIVKESNALYNESVDKPENKTITVNNDRRRKRKRVHKNDKNNKSVTINESKNIETDKNKGMEKNVNTRFKGRPERTHRRRITLLERLLAPDIRHERNVLLQCIRYIVQNNFFDKTEACQNSKYCFENRNEDQTNSSLEVKEVDTKS